MHPERRPPYPHEQAWLAAWSFLEDLAPAQRAIEARQLIALLESGAEEARMAARAETKEGG